MHAASKVVESGIEPKRSFADELRTLIDTRLNTFLLELAQQENFALERLKEWTPAERLLTLKEAAAYLHYQPRTIDSWTKGSQPLLQFRMLGGEKRFRKAWLDAAIDDGSIKPRGVVKL